MIKPQDAFNFGSVNLDPETGSSGSIHAMVIASSIPANWVNPENLSLYEIKHDTGLVSSTNVLYDVDNQEIHTQKINFIELCKIFGR